MSEFGVLLFRDTVYFTYSVIYNSCNQILKKQFKVTDSHVN